MYPSYPANFHNAHQEAQDGPATQRDRHVNVYRQVCRPVEDAAREGRNERGRIGGKKRDFTVNSIRLGIGGQLPCQQRFAKTCRNSRSRTEKSIAEEIIFLLKSLVFQARKTFFEKICEIIR